MYFRKSLKFITVLLIGLFGIRVLAETTKIHILQTSDIHSNTFGKNNNIYKLIKLLKAKQQKYGKENSLLIDCGDFIHGNFAASMTEGLTSIFLVKQINYDVAIIGNHELSYDINKVINASKKLGVYYFSANIIDTKTNKHFFKKYKLFEKNGLKILVVALTILESGCYDFLREYKFQNYESTLKELTQEFKNKKITADIYVLAVHDAFHNYPKNRIYKALKKYPFFNIILGGHHHRLVPGAKTPNDGFYTETASHAKGFTDITVEYDKNKRQILNISSNFIDVKKDSPEDTDLKNKHDDFFKSNYNSTTNKAFVTISNDILTNDIDKYNSSALNLVGAAMAKAVNSDYALVGQLKSKKGLKKGLIDDFKLYMFFQYEDMIYKISLNFDEYQSLVQNSLKTKRRTLNFYGLKTKINKDGKIIEDIILKNGKIWQKTPQQRVTFASNRFALTNWGNYYFVKIAKKQDVSLHKTTIKVRKAIKNFLSQQPNKIYQINKTKYLTIK